MKTVFTLEEVQSAFQRVEDLVASQGADADCMWAIHYAIEDGIRVLAGELEPETDGPDEDGLRQLALESRSEEEFDAAVARLGLFENGLLVAAVRLQIEFDWRPSPAGNEAMLGALEVYARKQAGALGRGASRSEAGSFARMEARWVYRRGS